MTDAIIYEARILPTIQKPSDVAKLNDDDLQTLAAEIRGEIIQTTAQTGGHLAPSLGTVELTLALCSIFSWGSDRVVWDVGHQAYAWKMLTGRYKEFRTLRQLNGISGFPRMAESPYDHFGVGHSSTSISAASGMAMARDLAEKKHKVVAVIGDGAMTGGMAYEALNQAGSQGKQLIVILNDNAMSISKNVGALSYFLSRNLSAEWALRLKKEVENILTSIPGIGNNMLTYAKRSETSFKSFFTPGMLFEAFDFNYVGPVNGHDITALKQAMTIACKVNKPVLLHVLTTKGKGYEPAEKNPSLFHGVGHFELETGHACKLVNVAQLPSYTDIFSTTLCRLAEKDRRIVAITAAMPAGTGLTEFSQRFPDRFVDVGICEQHAVTFAAGLATQGFKPVVALYSTFLQRAYDQVVHDVCLQNLPVTFCIDRGGLVGEDGATHHGVFDFSYLRHIPNIVICAPRDEVELQRAMVTAMNYNAPIAIRYPRGIGAGIEMLQKDSDIMPFTIGEGEILQEGEELAILAVGSRVHLALEAARHVEKRYGKRVTVFDARFVKPLPEKQLLQLANTHKKLLFVEENALAGGFSSAVLELLADNDALQNVQTRRIGIKDAFIPHGKQEEVRHLAGVDGDAVKAELCKMLGINA